MITENTYFSGFSFTLHSISCMLSPKQGSYKRNILAISRTRRESNSDCIACETNTLPLRHRLWLAENFVNIIIYPVFSTYY